MNSLELKLKISVLWMATTVVDLVQIVLSFMGPGFIEQLAKGKIGPMSITSTQIVVFSFSLLVPVLMAWLVLIIRNQKTNRRANLVVAIIIAALSWLDFLVRIPSLGIFILSAFATNLPPTLLIFYSVKLGGKE